MEGLKIAPWTTVSLTTIQSRYYPYMIKPLKIMCFRIAATISCWPDESISIRTKSTLPNTAKGTWQIC